MTGPTVLVVTGIDRTADTVIEALYRRGVPVVRFNLADLADDTSLTAYFGNQAGDVEGSVRTPSRQVDLTNVRALYYRRPTYPEPGVLSASEVQFVEDQIRYGAWGVLQVLPGCLYVNHPRRIAAAEWKPAQLQVAAQLGFDVPPTVITNELEKARSFAAAHAPVVYKLLAWSPYRIDGQARMVWVREVAPDELDASVSGTAHMFQAKIHPKAADLRITVVGEEIFAVKIKSPLTDWRENYALIESYQVFDTPPALAGLLVKYLRHWGLVYGCFDFGLGQDGRLWWYECNAAGEWGWIEDATGLPISRAFADVLEKGLI